MLANTRRPSRPIGFLSALAITTSVLYSPAFVHAEVSIANAPLFLTSSVDPNILFILDDSGSMHYEITPDSLRATGRTNGDVRFVFPRADGVYGGNDYTNNVATVDNNVAYNAIARSPQVNTTYYNPSITYTPWSKSDGTLYPNSSPSCALHNPERPGTTAARCRNLTVDNSNYNSPNWRTCTSATSCSSTTNNKTYWPATYFWHNGGSIWTWGNYTKQEIKPATTTYTGHGRANRTDCSGGVCTYDQEMQNFANWYTYYRSRVLAARAGVGRAFSQQGENLRVGYGAINKSSASIDGENTTTLIRGVRPFSGASRDEFFELLYEGVIPNEGTPLRRALDAAGQYFSRTDNRGPWGAIPGTNNSSSHLACRQSYTILMTDGYWTDGTSNQAATSGARQNVDNSNGPVITAPDGSTYQYEPADPYRDSNSNTLADIAMYYWNRDLRTDLANKVPTSPQNEAFWQHMVTFGVAFGVTGSVPETDAWSAVDNGAAISWPNPFDSEPAKLDDLLHAAINGRGGFFAAQDPDVFASEMSSVLDKIVARVEASGTAAATSSAVLQTDTLLYTASFRSSDWSGTIVAREVNADGVPGSIKWDAEARLASTLPTDRNIYTSGTFVDSDSGTSSVTAIALSYGSLNSAQQVALNVSPDGIVDNLGTARVNWLRGTEHASLRERIEGGITRRLGDLVNSDPQFMFRRDFGYSLLPGAEGGSYKTFRASNGYVGRPDVLFVGGNDGMLHAFHAGTPFLEIDDPEDAANPPAKIKVMDPDGGKELFAYVPSELLLPAGGAAAQINSLMDPAYSHRFYVDGTPAVADAYWGGGEWKTVLVGTMGVGGRTVFGLDVTDPENFDASKVLWEFTHPELGFGATQPTVARLNDGSWVAIFGNGYNSTSHRAQLFVVDIKTGDLRFALDTGVGSASTPNGLGAATVTDWPSGNLNVSRIYAADLQGNVWRFNLTNLSSPSVTKLFTATDASGGPQPITARPSVALRPGTQNEIVVLIGSGSYFRESDNNLTTPQTQSLYGIFDNLSGVTNTVRGDLLGQTISHNVDAVTIGGVAYPAGSFRFVSNNPLTNQKGWRIDLPSHGERVVSEATFPSGAVQTRVRFTTLIPNDDPCSAGRSGFLMDINLLSGGHFAESVFDLNKDGQFNSNDRVAGNIVSGIGGVTGERVTVIRDADSARDFLYSGGGEKIGEGENESGPIGRQSWRQLR